LRLLVAGSSPATIAVQTHRALKTVRHHIAAIHAVFGTNSSTALLAVCRRRGIGA
jgi:DNA-binding CsgD family transcriptional regulator